MVRHVKINNVFCANHVEDLIYGKKKKINIIEKNIGSSYGLMRAIQYDRLAIFLVIASQNYAVLRTIGLTLSLRRFLISLNTNIFSTMVPISIKTDVSYALWMQLVRK